MNPSNPQPFPPFPGILAIFYSRGWQKNLHKQLFKACLRSCQQCHFPQGSCLACVVCRRWACHQWVCQVNRFFLLKIFYGCKSSFFSFFFSGYTSASATCDAQGSKTEYMTSSTALLKLFIHCFFCSRTNRQRVARPQWLKKNIRIGASM